jgi:hypothetical protein
MHYLTWKPWQTVLTAHVQSYDDILISSSLGKKIIIWLLVNQLMIAFIILDHYKSTQRDKTLCWSTINKQWLYVWLIPGLPMQNSSGNYIWYETSILYSISETDPENIKKASIPETYHEESNASCHHLSSWLLGWSFKCPPVFIFNHLSSVHKQQPK